MIVEMCYYVCPQLVFVGLGVGIHGDPAEEWYELVETGRVSQSFFDFHFP